MAIEGISDNIIIARNDYVGRAATTVTGTSWTVELPVTNIETTKLAQVARSSATSANIFLDFTNSKTPTVVALPKHSLTSSATWRIRASNNATLLTDPDAVPLSDIVFDSNTVLETTTSSTSVDMSALTPPQSLTLIAAENARFFPDVNVFVKDSTLTNYMSGTVTSWNQITRELVLNITSKVGTATISDWLIDRFNTPTSIWPGAEIFGTVSYGEFTWGGQVDAVSTDTPVPAVIILPSDLSPARYMSIEIDDASNTDGYFDIGKLVVAPGWRPTLNYEYRWTMEYVDKSTAARARSGTLYIDQGPRFRRIKFRLNHLDRDEMYGNVFEMDRDLGIVDPMLVVLDPLDLTNLHKLTLYGSQPALGPITNGVHNSYTRDLIIEEWL